MWISEGTQNHNYVASVWYVDTRQASRTPLTLDAPGHGDAHAAEVEVAEHVHVVVRAGPVKGDHFSEQ